MAVDAYGNYTTSAAYTNTATTTTTTDDASSLSTDDFLTLLLTELQYQDPTEPMDTATILTQTSQLASIEAAENTNTALEDLASSLTTSSQYSTIAAIGKIGDTGSNAIVLEDGEDATFEMYLPEAATSGTINILDSSGNVMATVDMEATDAGVNEFTWDGTDGSGTTLDAGVYYVEATYTTADGTEQTTRVGTYPISAVYYADGVAYAKLGSSYVEFSSLAAISDS